jgi:hypothetical protein
MKEKKQEEDVIFEEITEEETSFKNKKDKKYQELEECKNERQEYLDG